MIGERDAFWMGRAVELSRRGFPAPNPHVGCVLVRGGEVVGEGWHDFAGGPHAEVVALTAAGELSRGATAYVTLEPCAHVGRTPACTGALLTAGVGRVVVAVEDPNPVAAGGAEVLRRAGLAVEVGVLRGEAEVVNRAWLQATRRGRAYVTVKVAASLDGFVALPGGESRWVTGAEAREDGHRWRAERGCVLVGRGTVEADDPQLTARVEGVVNQPVRVVLDPSGRLSGSERVFGEGGETVWLTREVLADFSVEGVLEELWSRGVRGVLVEGGPATVGRFLSAGVVDEVLVYLAPKVFGSGLGWSGGLVLGGAELLSERVVWELDSVSKMGRDLRLVYRSSGS